MRWGCGDWKSFFGVCPTEEGGLRYKRGWMVELLHTVVDDPDCCFSLEFIGDFVQVYLDC